VTRELPPLEPGQCGACGAKNQPLVDGLCPLCASVISAEAA
jgi:NMD protein affecting ribosome stability and mRNA decay